MATTTLADGIAILNFPFSLFSISDRWGNRFGRMDKNMLLSSW
jgi:hypothetical protein